MRERVGVEKPLRQKSPVPEKVSEADILMVSRAVGGARGRVGLAARACCCVASTFVLAGRPGACCRTISRNILKPKILCVTFRHLLRLEIVAADCQPQTK